LSTTPPLAFSQPHLFARLQALGDAELDTLDFGVIGFDTATVVRRYNAHESRAAGMSVPSVVGELLFDTIAQCMNNYLVAQRFEDAAEAGAALDAEVDYVLTLRVRPVPVKLRLLAEPGGALRYVLIRRLD